MKLSALKDIFKKDSNLSRIFSNMNWLILDKIYVAFIGLFVTAWMARYLGPNDFGILSYSLALVALFYSLSDLGLSNIVVRELVNKDKDPNAVLGSAFIMKLLSSFISYIILLSIVFIINADDVLIKIIVAIIGFRLLFRSMDVIPLWFKSEVKSRYEVIVRIVVSTISAAVKIAFILMNLPLLYFAFVLMAEVILFAVGYVIAYKITNQSLLLWKVKSKILAALLKDSWPMLFAAIVVTLYTKIDQIMIAKMIGNIQLGFYSAAIKLSELWYFLPIALANSVFPALIKAKKSNAGKYSRNLQRLYDLFTWSGIILAIAVSVFSRIIINIVFGPEYLPSAAVLTIHIWASIFVFQGVALNRYYVAENYTKIAFITTLSASLLNILLNIILIPSYGIIGAAYATLFSYLAAINLILVFRKTRAEGIKILKSYNLYRILKGIL